MAGSLGDQLLKAGVVDKKKAKQLKHQNRTNKSKQKQSGKKSNLQAETAQTQQQIEQAQREKQQRDLALNKQRDAERAQKAAIAEAKQIAQQHTVAIPKEAEVAYHFTDEKTIKKLYVSEAQQKQLTLGQLAIIIVDEGYCLVPDKVAEKIEKRLPEMVIRIEAEEKSDEDDPYAGYEIPDDLMW